MKRFLNRAAAVLALFILLPQMVSATRLLVPGGQVIGLFLEDNTVTVAAFDEALGSGARAAGLKTGDRIAKIDGLSIRSAADIQKALKQSDGTVQLHILRDGRARQLTLTPEITLEGPKLGIYLKQGITGIGTVTWYDPETGAFGALGHGVNTPEGSLVEMEAGQALPATVASVKKGRPGEPGQLMGTLDSQEALGELTKNTPQGIFGKMEAQVSGIPMPVAERSQVQTGAATILSTVSGKAVREYSVEILKIYPNDRASGRNMLLRVTDPALLAATGGIVQGM